MTDEEVNATINQMEGNLMADEKASYDQQIDKLLADFPEIRVVRDGSKRMIQLPEEFVNAICQAALTTLGASIMANSGIAIMTPIDPQEIERASIVGAMITRAFELDDEKFGPVQ